MASFVLRRILATIVVMAVVALFVFSLLHLAPGDPAAIIAGDLATSRPPPKSPRIRDKLGLNEPLWLQFWRWRSNPAVGELGDG
jgi:peptide/nickel transport system permease protein